MPEADAPLHARLIDAAERCFDRDGVAHTTMRDVAAEAGVSRTSLYKHFASMDAVLQAVFVREFDRFERRLRRALARCSSEEEKLVQVVVGIAENIPRSSTIGTLVRHPANRSEERALAVGRAALDVRVRKLIEAPLDALKVAGRLRRDTSRAQMVEWIRTLVHAFSAARRPKAWTRSERRQMIERFMLPSLLANGSELTAEDDLH